MADSQGRTKGDAGYDPFSESDPSQSGTGANDPSLSTAFPSPTKSTVPSITAPKAGATFSPSTGQASGVVPYDPALSANWTKTTNPDGSITAAPPAGPDFTTPGGQLTAVTGWLQSGGFGGDDPNYWVGRINDTGGFTPANLQYWQARIAAGPQGGSPGGQYYDPAAAGGGDASVSDPIDASLRQAILDQIGKDTAPVSLSDPALSGQAAAYHVTQQRSSDQMRSALAERLAAEGLNSGGQGSGTFDTGVQGIQEQQGQNEAGFNANLVAQETQARRQDLTNQLQLANAVGARKEAAQIQLALSQLDQTYKYAALNQNESQFTDSTIFNYEQLKAQMDRDAILHALGLE